MKNKALNTFYTNLLEDVGVVDGGDGKLSYHRIDVDDKIAITVEGKRLTLPTRENLQSSDSAIIMFHPASEQLMSGPSPILDAFRDYVMLRLSTTAASIAMAAMTAAQSNALQKKCKGKGNELLRVLTGADAKMESTLEKVLDNVGMTPETRMYNIFLVAQGSKENPRGLRTAKVSYPILDDAHSGDETEFFGVKMPRKTKDKPSIVGLLSLVLGVDPEESNPIAEYTSTLHQAPYFHSLLTAFMSIAKHQNELIDGLVKAVPNLKELKYKLNWSEEFEDFEDFIKKVGYAAPLLPGNKGKDLVGDEGEEEEGGGKEESLRASTSSWKAIRDSIEEDEEVEEERESRSRPVERSRKGEYNWKEALGSRRDSERGVSFGDGSRRSRRGGFSSMVRDRDDDDRDSRRGGYRERRYESRGSDRDDRNLSWRDRFR